MITLIVILQLIIPGIIYYEYKNLNNIYIPTQLIYTLSENKYLINVLFDNNNYELHNADIINNCNINELCEFYYNPCAVPNSISNYTYNDEIIECTNSLIFKYELFTSDINFYLILFIIMMIFSIIILSIYIWVIY